MFDISRLQRRKPAPVTAPPHLFPGWRHFRSADVSGIGWHGDDCTQSADLRMQHDSRIVLTRDECHGKANITIRNSGSHWVAESQLFRYLVFPVDINEIMDGGTELPLLDADTSNWHAVVKQCEMLVLGALSRAASEIGNNIDAYGLARVFDHVHKDSSGFYHVNEMRDKHYYTNRVADIWRQTRKEDRR